MKIYDKQGNLLVGYDLHAGEHEAGGADALALGSIAGNLTGAQHGNPVLCGGDFSAIDMRIRCRTSDPASPADGEMWLRTDL